MSNKENEESKPMHCDIWRLHSAAACLLGTVFMLVLILSLAFANE